MKYFIRLCMLLLVFGFTVAQAAISIPAKLPQELVLDYASTLSGQQKTELSQKLRAYYEKTSNVLVVVTIPSLEATGEASLQDWNMKLFDAWKPGDATKNNSLIITISGKNAPYKVRINPGRGLTGALPDAFLKGLIEDKMKPVLNAPTNYYAGINVALDAVIAKTGSEFSAVTETSKSNSSPHYGIWILIAVVVAFFLGFLSPVMSLIIGLIAGGIIGSALEILVVGLIVGGIAGLLLGVISRTIGNGGDVGSALGDVGGSVGDVVGGVASIATGGDSDGGGAGD